MTMLKDELSSYDIYVELAAEVTLANVILSDIMYSPSQDPADSDRDNIQPGVQSAMKRPHMLWQGPPDGSTFGPSRVWRIGSMTSFRSYLIMSTHGAKGRHALSSEN